MLLKLCAGNDPLPVLCWWGELSHRAPFLVPSWLCLRVQSLQPFWGTFIVHFEAVFACIQWTLGLRGSRFVCACIRYTYLRMHWKCSKCRKYVVPVQPWDRGRASWNRAIWKGLRTRFNFPAGSFLSWPVTSVGSGYSSCLLEAETPALITDWELVLHDDV